MAGCSELVYDPARPPKNYLRAYSLEPPASWEAFETCHHYDCSGHSLVQLQGQEWQQVRQLFSPPISSAEEEREQIAASIGLLEKLVGIQNNTFADQACNNFKQPVQSFQLDCVAESLNTTVYLQLLQDQQLLLWHQVSYPTDRNIFSLNAPHTTAVITQNDTDQRYAVDSWFHANGKAAEVVPLERWRQGFYPGPCP